MATIIRHADRGKIFDRMGRPASASRRRVVPHCHRVGALRFNSETAIATIAPNNMKDGTDTSQVTVSTTAESSFLGKVSGVLFWASLDISLS
jgi:hypothetical protein